MVTHGRRNLYSMRNYYVYIIIPLPSITHVAASTLVSSLEKIPPVTTGFYLIVRSRRIIIA